MKLYTITYFLSLSIPCSFFCFSTHASFPTPLTWLSGEVGGECLEDVQVGFRSQGDLVLGPWPEARELGVGGVPGPGDPLVVAGAGSGACAGASAGAGLCSRWNGAKRDVIVARACQNGPPVQTGAAGGHISHLQPLCPNYL